MLLPVTIYSVPGHTGNPSHRNQHWLTQHIDKSPGCLNFLAKQALTVAPYGSSVMQPQKHRHEDANVAWTSNKRPALLRRHMVYDDVAASGAVAVPAFASYPNLQVVGTTAEAKLPLSDEEMTKHLSDRDNNENDSFVRGSVHGHRQRLLTPGHLIAISRGIKAMTVASWKWTSWHQFEIPRRQETKSLM